MQRLLSCKITDVEHIPEKNGIRCIVDSTHEKKIT
jgi:hypothetical protein